MKSGLFISLTAILSLRVLLLLLPEAALECVEMHGSLVPIKVLVSILCTQCLRFSIWILWLGESSDIESETVGAAAGDEKEAIGAVKGSTVIEVESWILLTSNLT